MQLDPTLLASLLDPANEDDDGLRLVIADWLEEHDQPERAEFVRVQVELAATPPFWKPVSDPGAKLSIRYEALRRRERELLGNYQYDWLNAETGTLWHHWGGPPAWRRGFIHALTCTAANWLAHAEALLATQPVRQATLTTLPGGPYGSVATRFVTEWPHVRFTLPENLADKHGGYLVPAEFAEALRRLPTSSRDARRQRKARVRRGT